MAYNELELLLESAPSSKILICGKEYLYFGGTSYFEFQSNEKVLLAANEATLKYGITSSSSRISYGNTPLIAELENEAAKYFGCEESVYLPSGYLTDVAAISALERSKMFDVIFIDEASHYSNKFATRFCEKPIVTFSHLNEEDLYRKVSSRKNQRPLIITDGVFPIYGDIAPIDKYLEIAKTNDGIIWIDDAHGIGVLGNNGKGTVEHFNLKDERIFFGGTFSKAFGGFGGIIPGRKEFIKGIKSGDIFAGTTAAPSSAIAAALTSIIMMKENPQQRIKLWENAKRLKDGLRSISIETNHTCVPIAAWQTKNKDDAKKIFNNLFDKNIAIQLIKYSGTMDKEVLRVVVFSTHTFEQIDKLILEIKNCYDEY